jgi:hypothetical protein
MQMDKTAHASFEAPCFRNKYTIVCMALILGIDEAGRGPLGGAMLKKHDCTLP